jgi:hypothetical protein
MSISCMIDFIKLNNYIKWFTGLRANVGNFSCTYTKHIIYLRFPQIILSETIYYNDDKKQLFMLIVITRTLFILINNNKK